MLYQHFASKEDVLLEYLRRTHEVWFAELAAFGRVCATPREQVLAPFDYRLRQQQQAGYRGCPFLKINAEAACESQRVFALVAAYQQRLRRYVREVAAPRCKMPGRSRGPAIWAAYCYELAPYVGGLGCYGGVVPRSAWLSLVVILAAPLLSVLDVFTANMVIPAIRADLRATRADVNLVIAGYLLGYPAFVITDGRAGDQYGRRRVSVVGRALFTLTSCLGGLAPSIWQLTVH